MTPDQFRINIQKRIRALENYEHRPLLRSLVEMFEASSTVSLGANGRAALFDTIKNHLWSVERHLHFLDPARFPAFIYVETPDHPDWACKGMLFFQAQRFPGRVFVFVAYQEANAPEPEFIPSLIEIQLVNLIDHGQLAHCYARDHDKVVARLMRLCEIVTPDDLIHELAAATLNPTIKDDVEALILAAKKALAAEFLPALTAGLMVSSANIEWREEGLGVAPKKTWLPIFQPPAGFTLRSNQLHFHPSR